MSLLASGQRERSIAVEGGRRLFLSERVGEGNRLPVLFLSSLAADVTMWNGVRDHLDRQTVAFDTRGHGRSDVVPGDADLKALADDAVAVMDAVGLERAVVCGLSLGGITAMQMAAEVPGRIAGLVLANTAVSFPPAQMWRDRAAMARRGAFEELVQPTLERWLTQSYRDAEPETAESVRRMIRSTDPDGYAAACAALATGDATDALKSFRGPVLAIVGRHDQSTPVARAEEIVSLAQKGELVVLDAAHVAAIERAEEFAAALERFIERIEHHG